MDRRSGVRLFWALLAAGLLAAGLGLRSRLAPEATPAIRGEAVARRAGCFACHGESGRGGVANPGAPSGRVPGWDEASMAMHARGPGEMREWIERGTPARLAAWTAARARRQLLPMPAYGDRLSGAEIQDLVAYLAAVSGWDPGMPEAAHEGRILAGRLGCFHCHGPSGMGGTPNPGSLKGAIPPWTGADFAELARDEAELREWILDGRPARLWKNPIARRFLERQAIRMPAYRRHLSEDETAKIIAYIRRLRGT